MRRYWLQNDNIKDYTCMITLFVQHLQKCRHKLWTIEYIIMEEATYFEQIMRSEKIHIKPKLNSIQLTNKIQFYRSQFHPHRVPHTFLHQEFKVSLKLKCYDQLIICSSMTSSSSAYFATFLVTTPLILPGKSNSSKFRTTTSMWH